MYGPGVLDEKIDNNNNTALHGAVLADNMDSIEFLMENKPQLLRTQNADGKTPLHLAVEGYIGGQAQDEKSKSEQIIRAFLAHKDSNILNIADGNNKTLLDYLKDSGLDRNPIYEELRKAGAKTYLQVKFPVTHFLRKSQNVKSESALPARERANSKNNIHR